MSAPGARSQTPKVASVVKTEASSGIDFDAEVGPTDAVGSDRAESLLGDLDAFRVRQLKPHTCPPMQLVGTRPSSTAPLVPGFDLLFCVGRELQLSHDPEFLYPRYRSRIFKPGVPAWPAVRAAALLQGIKQPVQLRFRRRSVPTLPGSVPPAQPYAANIRDSPALPT